MRFFDSSETVFKTDASVVHFKTIRQSRVTPLSFYETPTVLLRVTGRRFLAFQNYQRLLTVTNSSLAAFIEQCLFCAAAFTANLAFRQVSCYCSDIFFNRPKVVFVWFVVRLFLWGKFKNSGQNSNTRFVSRVALLHFLSNLVCGGNIFQSELVRTHRYAVRNLHIFPSFRERSFYFPFNVVERPLLFEWWALSQQFGSVVNVHFALDQTR